ncbi:acetoacetate--CoA ligase [Mycobacterium deserti]|uniref:Acetoacetate--CoA ligase n=1 Tax=Mycobacterium deserti TaxID=2978347 RepID=A0ABT2M6X3_9MYCO|nr:acetoacetate--CoA ligase [Mycobacterium deserti]MCT7658010.1 acetoacetate--CoA ligase [Mycobacterium deserti]
MTDIIWEPDLNSVERSRIWRFTQFVETRHRLQLRSYGDLHRWSVDNIEAFWQAVWDFFAVGSVSEPIPVLAAAKMPGATWYPGALLNYAEYALRHGHSNDVAIVGAAEDGGQAVILTRRELRRQVAALANTLRNNGVGQGDVVVGYLPNIPEAAVAFLAAASIGAIWACCGQDYAVPAALARLGQLEPAALIGADGYRFNGAVQDRASAVTQLAASMPSVRLTIAVNHIGSEVTDAMTWAHATDGDPPMEPLPVAFDHPLWVVFSSGSTGVPKGIVHGHGGVLLEQLKSQGLHFDLGAADTFFWFTTPSWMLWNTVVSGLLVGAQIVCYDGSPVFPHTAALWDIADRLAVTVLGVSPGYLQLCQRQRIALRNGRSLEGLKCVGVTGSTLAADVARWAASEVGPTVRLAAVSGGTDVVTGFVGSAPTLPTRAGEISAPCLGVAVDAYDDSGRPLVGEVGELVVTRPMPSMPVGLWGDSDGSRYRETYFSMFPGVWRQGDWITITDHGGVIMHGRSDSTLNRNGVRMGSADIYDIVEQLPEVREALVLGVEGANGDYWMPLFVVLDAEAHLDDALRGRIAEAIRTYASPRHVPDTVIQAPGIPHTRTGKKLEVPMKRLMQGADPMSALDPGATDNPELIDWYVDFARARLTTTVVGP